MGAGVNAGAATATPNAPAGGAAGAGVAAGGVPQELRLPSPNGSAAAPGDCGGSCRWFVAPSKSIAGGSGSGAIARCGCGGSGLTAAAAADDSPDSDADAESSLSARRLASKAALPPRSAARGGRLMHQRSAAGAGAGCIADTGTNTGLARTVVRC